MSLQTKHFYAFGPFRLDSENRVLVRDGLPIPLPPKAAETLLLLVENAGRLVSKEDLMKRVWPDAFVEEANLPKNILTLRKALGEWGGGREYIETVPKRGYRFVEPVEEVTHAEGASRPQPSGSANLIGKKVSHYRVLEVIGGGGMGLVYKAEDLKLGRRVALKFLPEEVADNPIALQRFEREARTASSLNHPNICSIHEFGEHDGQPFLVMELLEGETLRDFLVDGSKPVPLDRLLDIALQIANGLEAAHELGIIHRDIKPANIFLTRKGTAKILDFGLAKLVGGGDAVENLPGVTPNALKGRGFSRAATAPSSDPLVLQSVRELERELFDTHEVNGVPLQSQDAPEHTLTRTGMAMGTAGYMSPEQVRREPLDARTDLFSFGLVLYEMATGQRAFTGETAAILKDAILNHTAVPVLELNPAVPHGLEVIIDKALKKNREQRYQTAAEMGSDLLGLKTDSGQVVASGGGKGRWPLRRKWQALVLALALVAAGIGLLYPWLRLMLRRQIRIAQLQRLTIVPLTSLTGNVASPTFSPDGTQIAFAWDGENNGKGFDLYVKVIGNEKPLRLTHLPGLYQAAWSPDGKNIAMVRRVYGSGNADAGVYLVSPLGGPERRITQACRPGLNSNELVWSPDGRQLVCTDLSNPFAGAASSDTIHLFSVSLDSLQVTPIKTGCNLTFSPAFSPRGDYLARACADAGGTVSIELQKLDDGTVTHLLHWKDLINGLIWSRDGQRIIFSSGLDFGDIWEVGLARPDHAEKLLLGHDASYLAVSPAGNRLAFIENRRNTNIWRLDLEEPQPQARKVVTSSREQTAPNLSPSGDRLTFESNRSGSNEVWVSDIDGSNAVQLSSFGIRITGTPRWSPDGKLIAFDSRAGGEANIYLADPHGGVPHKLDIDIRGNSEPSWSHDGRWIYFVNGYDAHYPTGWKVPSTGGHAVPIAKGEVHKPVESADGQYVYFVRQSRLWSARTDGTEEHEIEEIPASMAIWAWTPFKSGIYFMAWEGGKTAIKFFDLATKKMQVIHVLEKDQPISLGGIAVSSDGKYLLFPQVDEQSSDAMMIENWI